MSVFEIVVVLGLLYKIVEVLLLLYKIVALMSVVVPLRTTFAVLIRSFFIPSFSILRIKILKIFLSFAILDACRHVRSWMILPPLFIFFVHFFVRHVQSVSVVDMNNVATVDNVGRKPVIVNIFVDDVRHFFFYGIQ